MTTMPKLGPFQDTFNVDDRVEFNVIGGLIGTGIILGCATRDILDRYIVLLDNPIPGYKAIIASSSELKKI